MVGQERLGPPPDVDPGRQDHEGDEPPDQPPERPAGGRGRADRDGGGHEPHRGHARHVEELEEMAGAPEEHAEPVPEGRLRRNPHECHHEDRRRQQHRERADRHAERLGGLGARPRRRPPRAAPGHEVDSRLQADPGGDQGEPSPEGRVVDRRHVVAEVRSAGAGEGRDRHQRRARRRGAERAPRRARGEGVAGAPGHVDPERPREGDEPDGEREGHMGDQRQLEGGGGEEPVHRRRPGERRQPREQAGHDQRADGQPEPGQQQPPRARRDDVRAGRPPRRGEDDLVPGGGIAARRQQEGAVEGRHHRTYQIAPSHFQFRK